MAAGTEGSTRIYVGNLTRDIENREVEDAFGKFGDIANLWVGRNPPGFGFIVSAPAAPLDAAPPGPDPPRHGCFRPALFAMQCWQGLSASSASERQRNSAPWRGT